MKVKFRRVSWGMTSATKVRGPGIRYQNQMLFIKFFAYSTGTYQGKNRLTSEDGFDFQFLYLQCILNYYFFNLCFSYS